MFHAKTQNSKVMKKRSEETQSLRAGCSKAEPKIFRSAADPRPGGEGRPTFNELDVVPNFTCKPVWWGSMHTISSYRGNRPIHTQTHTHTHKQTGPITIHWAAASAV